MNIIQLLTFSGIATECRVVMFVLRIHLFFFFITILSLIIFFLQSTRHLFFLPSVILKLKLMFLVCRGVVSCSVDSQTSDEPLVVWNLSRQRKQNVCHYVTV